LGPLAFGCALGPVADALFGNAALGDSVADALFGNAALGDSVADALFGNAALGDWSLTLSLGTLRLGSIKKNCYKTQEHQPAPYHDMGSIKHRTKHPHASLLYYYERLHY